MFYDQESIGRGYAIKFEDGTYVMQGHLVRMYRKKHRAEKVLADSQSPGKVVSVLLSEIAYKEPQKTVDVSGIHMLFTDLAYSVSEASSLDLYKSYCCSGGGYNVLRHTHLGEKPCYEPGERYKDVELHFKMRINY